MATLFAICVGILGVGFVWFFVARPILESYGVISTVNDNDAAPAPLMSRSEGDAPASAAPRLQTDGAQTDRPPLLAKPDRAKLLTLYQLMRAAGIGRDPAGAALRGVGLPLDNNLWADAAPADDAAHVTPIVGRRTSAVFESDPELRYEAPA